MTETDKFKTAMVFGVFDGLHEGHRYFLSEALKRSDALIVVVTLPEMVKRLKNREPKNSLDDRIFRLNSFHPRIQTIVGDSVLGEWQVLKDHRPDIILLGHDQQAIAKELQRMGMPFIFMEKYENSD